MELYKGDEGSSSSSSSTSISEAIFQSFHPSATPPTLSSATHHIPQYSTRDRSSIVNDGVDRVVATAATTTVESSGGVGLISQLQGFNILPSHQSLPLPIATLLANSSHQMHSSTTQNHIPPIYHYQHQQHHQQQQFYSSLLPPPHVPLYGSDHVVLPPIGMPTGFYMGGTGGTSLSPFTCLQSEFGKMSAQEMMDAKALAASKSHSEAERRRRERINTHLARLRSLLPSTTKTDKASLLAEVIQHVKELKRQAAEIVEQIPVPTESDELTVHAANEEDDGKLVVKASMCCDDRSDLLSELIKALKALRLRTLKAEITTLGGRIKNVLVVTEEDDCINNPEETRHHYSSITSIQDALKAVMDKTTSAPDPNNNDPSSSSSSANKLTGTGTSTKKQRTTNLSSILEKNL